MSLVIAVEDAPRLLGENVLQAAYRIQLIFKCPQPPPVIEVERTENIPQTHWPILFFDTWILKFSAKYGLDSEAA